MVSSSCLGFFSLGMICWGVTPAFWGCTFKSVCMAPSSASRMLTEDGWGNAEKVTLSSPLSQKSREQWAPTWTPHCEVFFLFLCVLSSRTFLQTQQWEHALLSWAPNPAEHLVTFPNQSLLLTLTKVCWHAFSIPFSFPSALQITFAFSFC